MNRRWYVQTALLLALTGGAIMFEIWGAADPHDSVPTWTELLARFIPPILVYGAFAVLCLWFPGCMAYAYWQIWRARNPESWRSTVATRGTLSQRLWLKADALNRAWRSFMHAVGATMALAALDAAAQVLQKAAKDQLSGEVVDWKQVGTVAGVGAIFAAMIPLTAYLHRMKVDPSVLPSALPPEPPLAGPVAVAPPNRQGGPA